MSRYRVWLGWLPMGVGGGCPMGWRVAVDDSERQCGKWWNMQVLKNSDEGWKFTWVIAWRLIRREWEWTMPLKRAPGGKRGRG